MTPTENERSIKQEAIEYIFRRSCESLSGDKMMVPLTSHNNVFTLNLIRCAKGLLIHEP